MDAITTIERDGFRLEIFQDDSPESPANWGWPIEVIQTRHPLEREDKRAIIEEYGNIWYCQIPTQGRDYHYVIAKKSDWLKAMKEGKEKAEYKGYAATKSGMYTLCNQMADNMKQYYEGDIYGYVVSVARGCDWETLESVWGFYGMDAVESEGKAELERALKTEQDAKAFEHSAMAI